MSVLIVFLSLLVDGRYEPIRDFPGQSHVVLQSIQMENWKPTTGVEVPFYRIKVRNQGITSVIFTRELPRWRSKVVNKKVVEFLWVSTHKSWIAGPATKWISVCADRGEKTRFSLRPDEYVFEIERIREETPSSDPGPVSGSLFLALTKRRKWDR